MKADINPWKASRTLTGLAAVVAAGLPIATANADPSAADAARVAACRSAEEAICKAHLACNAIPGFSETLYSTMGECQTAWGPACSVSPKDRPQRPLANAIDRVACLASARAASRNATTCEALHDQEQTPECARFMAEAFTRDYSAGAATIACAPGYLRDGGVCRAACHTAADCNSTLETCGDAAHPGVCVTLPAPRRK